MYIVKGVVFSFNKDIRKKSIKKISFSDIRYYFKRYGVRTLFVLIFFFGLTCGSIYAQNADSEMLYSLDFLFTTNMDARLSQSTLNTFCACFASNFIFLIVIYLFGLAPWGMPTLPFVVMFKGFGTGLTAGYLFILNNLSGLGFYLLVLLPGSFLFCLSMITFANYAFDFSRTMFLHTVSKSIPKQSLRQGVFAFSSQLMSSLIMTFFAALLDTILWTLFAGMFNF